MQIIHIETQKRVLKTKKEKAKELRECKNEMSKMLVGDYKLVPNENPMYIVEMTNSEYQLVSFYLELEKRKPIMNVKLDVEKENNNE